MVVFVPSPQHRAQIDQAIARDGGDETARRLGVSPMVLAAFMAGWLTLAHFPDVVILSAQLRKGVLSDE